MKILQLGVELGYSVCTDGQTYSRPAEDMTKLTVVFHNFANAYINPVWTTSTSSWFVVFKFLYLAATSPHQSAGLT